MSAPSAVVFDIGKTNAKLTLWSPERALLDKRTRPNAVINSKHYRSLDVQGLENWLADTLHDFAKRADIECIIPVGHGAAAALIQHDELFTPPMDYEDDPDPLERDEYRSQRDEFALTGSPALPHGLNLGMQLHRIERLTGPWPTDLRILLWPQYWAWRLCGVMASEVTSLGCHSDLWRPLERNFTDLAERRGWAAKIPSLHNAWDPLGSLNAEWALRTGISRNCRVLCGLHDSNAALLAARGRPQVAGREFTVLSTGTWFVAMRVTLNSDRIDFSRLQEHRDCLLNVDPHKNPVPSARFMGGRETELIAPQSAANLPTQFDAAELQRLEALLGQGSAALPSFVPGVGPFPSAKARWLNRPDAPDDQRIMASLYLALMADASLSLIGSSDHIIIEGRFSKWDLFVRALARLRTAQKLFVAPAQDDIAFGALRLAQGDFASREALAPVAPLDIDLDAFARRWRAHAMD
jgi:sugar (pentulose or hexulose) kinase